MMLVQFQTLNGRSGTTLGDYSHLTLSAWLTETVIQSHARVHVDQMGFVSVATINLEWIVNSTMFASQ